MRVNLKALVIATVALAGLAATVQPVHAQGLGEVARKEEERRKDVKAPAKVYTNKDLGSAPGGRESGAVSSSPPAAAADAANAADDKAKAKGDDKDKDKDKDRAEPPKDQAYWAGRRKNLQGKLESDQTLVDAMQSRINALTADFASRSDPVQRAGIERDRTRALAELDRLRKSIVENKKALTDLDEDARKAGVPAGWLR
jgi:hypothetical protein